MASIDLMLERYSRIQSEETLRNGLMISAAVYGKIFDGTINIFVDLPTLLLFLF